MMISINDPASGSNLGCYFWMNQLLKVGLINFPLTEENQVSEHWILMDLCDLSYVRTDGASV